MIRDMFSRESPVFNMLRMKNGNRFQASLREHSAHLHISPSQIYQKIAQEIFRKTRSGD